MSSGESSFLENLAEKFHVENRALAIFLLVLICLASTSVLVFFILCISSSVRKMRLRKLARKRMKSVYLDELAGNEKVKGKYGQLTYSIQYDIPAAKLTVIVIEANKLNLLPEDELLDTYVTVKLASGKHGRLEQIGNVQRTDVQRRTMTPRWHFQCKFDLKMDDLKYAILIFEIFDYDSIGQDRSIGRLTTYLANLDVSAYVGTPLENTEWLKAGEPKFLGLGETCIGLNYHHALERLECHVYEARCLHVSEYLSANKHQKISIRVSLRCKRNSLGSFETHSQKELTNPYFNEKFSFHLNVKQLPDAKLVFHLRSRGSYGRKCVLGSFTIGPNTDMSSGAKHWEEMVQNSPRSHVMWHTWIPKDF
ncbi:Synaptotagmin-2 [Clonorchis sinensis]|uniref:Synaptotagmin-2 n=2 Tax=Clonorchis sinensis TaxID=79923 RepID=H2KPI3_CLOSI|nr:Synaptotagmin-2 [Clonorchis sinensis]GAA35290.1 synaptotagmin-2 [Clonorchis sinensis]